ncbi:hypothetical protein E2562_024646 [Oryza meyeriana var. granulata]|uniref:Retrotransposon gag domain-containing protein n=1 Tax=Oryza meyeriana var. granulata TaxID=110450 RepID=A0A6G1EDQ3_9ORYZ|nr:hypothetical protein E2562_024646 [Oryza meyeriana var. granulata]
MAHDNQENEEIGNNSVDESQAPNCGGRRGRGHGRGRGRGRHNQAELSNQLEDEDMVAEEDDDHLAAESKAAHATRAVRGMTLTRWMSMRLDTFDGLGTPVNAADWLRKMEKYMNGSKMTAEDKQLRAKYYPESFRDRMSDELNHIQWGSKTVDEYEREFSNIVRFVPTVASDEREKTRRFFRGLNARYREVMGRNPPTVYLNAVKEARGMDIELQITAAQKNHSGNAAGGDQKRVHQEGGKNS